MSQKKPGQQKPGTTAARRQKPGTRAEARIAEARHDGRIQAQWQKPDDIRTRHDIRTQARGSPPEAKLAEARHAGRSQDSRSQTRHQDPGTTQEARLAEARHAGRSQDSRSQAPRQKPGTTAEARHDITTQARHKNPSTTTEARQDRRTPVPAAVSKVNRPDTERIPFLLIPSFHRSRRSQVISTPLLHHCTPPHTAIQTFRIPRRTTYTHSTYPNFHPLRPRCAGHSKARLYNTVSSAPLSGFRGCALYRIYRILPKLLYLLYPVCTSRVLHFKIKLFWPLFAWRRTRMCFPRVGKCCLPALLSRIQSSFSPELRLSVLFGSRMQDLLPLLRLY